jgi:hypothetical protein
MRKAACEGGARKNRQKAKGSKIRDSHAKVQRNWIADDFVRSVPFLQKRDTHAHRLW